MSQDDSEPQQNDSSPRESLLAELITRLFRDAESLLLQEFALARLEMGENLGHLTGGAALLAIGIVIAFSGGLAFMAAAALVLSYVLPLWVACLLVGAAIFALGAAVALQGRHLLTRATLLPRRTLQSLRETGVWAREELT